MVPETIALITPSPLPHKHRVRVGRNTQYGPKTKNIKKDPVKESLQVPSSTTRLRVTH